MNQLVDRFGREHTYLRISVTDRCNLRCVYCMPPEGIDVRRKDLILSFEEIQRIAHVFCQMGITKIRLTGGEPLVRKDLVTLIGQLSALPGIKALAMTTNAVLLKDKARALRAAGLSALNISLDSLNKERFKAITLRDDWDNVMAGIYASLAEGFDSIKLNVVVINGTNADEILDFVEFVKDKDVNVRFIEYMPFKDNHWQAAGVFSYADMKRTIEEKYTLVPRFASKGDVAKDFYIKGHSGTVSFITSMTDSFCGSCNRLRLTADGSIKSCLFFAPEIHLRDVLRAGITDDELRVLIRQAVAQKPESHPPMEELAAGDNRAMVEIGG